MKRMKNFWVCCTAVLCISLAGCAGNQQKTQNLPGQEDAQQEAPVRTVEDSPHPEEQPEPPEPDITPESAAPSDQFAGVWRDAETSQCRVEISCADGGSYAIVIDRSVSPQESDVWELTGTYDEIWEGIAYIGAKYGELTGENGTVERKPIPEREEITGLLFFEDDGTLHWIDDFDHTGDDLTFEKE